MSVQFNDIQHLFDNIAHGGENLIVCVEHERVIPCRKCLYREPASTPYSDDPDTVKRIVRQAYFA